MNNILLSLYAFEFKTIAIQQKVVNFDVDYFDAKIAQSSFENKQIIQINTTLKFAMKKNIGFQIVRNGDEQLKVLQYNSTPETNDQSIVMNQSYHKLRGKARIDKILGCLNFLVRKLTKNPDNLFTFDRLIRDLGNYIEQQIQQVIRSSPNQKVIRQNIQKCNLKQSKLNAKPFPYSGRITSPSKIKPRFEFIDDDSPLLKKIKRIKTQTQNQTGFQVNPEAFRISNHQKPYMIHKKDILAATFNNGKINNPIGGIYSKTLIQNGDIDSEVLKIKKRHRNKLSIVMKTES